MTTAATDPLRPRPPGGMGRGTTLAVVVHLGLVVALAIGVQWRTAEPEGLSAELWANVPQQAAPREEVAPPPPPPPPPKAATPRTEEPQREADIALEKARKEKLAKEKAEREKAEREKVEREKLAREKAEREKAEKEKIEKAQRERAEREKTEAAQRKKKEDEDKRLAKLREENLKRIQGLAGATGGPTSTGTAQQSTGPSAGYGAKVRSRIEPNIVLLDEVPGNPMAEVEVRAAPDGTIVSRRIVRSSGNKDWDEAVLRAIDRTELLPRDSDGSVPSSFLITFRPRKT